MALASAVAGASAKSVGAASLRISQASALSPSWAAVFRAAAPALKERHVGVFSHRSAARQSLSVQAVAVTEKLPAVGQKLPPGEFAFFDKEGNLQTISVDALTKGKKVVLFAVPGAFTPTCSERHLPGFMAKSEELKSKGVDAIACISVNDPFVMRAWGEQLGVGDKVLLLADGSGKFTSDFGVTLDLTGKGLGVRSRRYALLADDGVVKVLNLEEGGAFTVSSAEDILKAL